MALAQQARVSNLCSEPSEPTALLLHENNVMKYLGNIPMTYYRLAVQDRHSTHWIWKTTVVNSLQAVLQLLRGYRMLPQDGIRVFSASSQAELNEMLRRQNNSLDSGSVTAAQFLQARKIAAGEQAQSASEEHTSPPTGQQGTAHVASGAATRTRRAGLRSLGTTRSPRCPALPTSHVLSLPAWLCWLQWQKGGWG